MIIQCPTCKPHTYQDKKYGKNMRVHNVCKEHGKYRCTVCGKTNTFSVKVREGK